MTPEQVSELAKETAEDEIDQYFARLRNDPKAAPMGDGVQSALKRLEDAEADLARHVAALKAACDAFESLRNNQNSRDCAGIVATNALSRIKELLP